IDPQRAAAGTLSASLQAPSRTELCSLSLHDALPIFRLSSIPKGSSSSSRRGESAKARAMPTRWRMPLDISAASLSFASARPTRRSEEHTSELQSRENLVCRLLLEKKKHGDIHAGELC